MLLSCWVSIFFSQRGPHVMRHLSPVTSHMSLVGPCLTLWLCFPISQYNTLWVWHCPRPCESFPCVSWFWNWIIAQYRQKNLKKTLMFPWLLDINLFNISSGSHGKLLNPVVFFHALALLASSHPSPPSAFSLAISRSLSFFLISSKGLFSCINQEAPRKWMIRDYPARRLADNY